MPNCTRCGKKVSVFGVTADGLCAECAKAGREELQAERERKQQEAQAAEEQEKAKEREAWEEKRAERPPLRAYCEEGKTVWINKNCVLIESKESIAAIPIRNIQEIELVRPKQENACWEMKITSAKPINGLVHTVRSASAMEVSFLNDIFEYIIEK